MTEDTLYQSPDCRDNQHHKCSGTGWNETQAQFDTCPCQCHPTTK